jgi:hypothetical protein
LFSQTKTTGSFQMAAMFMHSCNVPTAAAPSPKKATATWAVLRTLAEMPAPRACATPAPTMGFTPRIPLRRSVMCIEPPLPRLVPVIFPNSSAIIGLTSAPFAMQCPWPRWVDAIQSSGSRAAQTPTATASWPIE